MSKIGNIYLIWRKGQGSRRIPVGIIKRNSIDGTRFEYIQKNIKKAEEQGFIPYTGFPDLSKTYTKNVLEIFSQRIVKSERNDLSTFFEFWHIDPSKKKDSYYMLAHTQGILPTDNFEFLADFNPKKSLTFVTEITGLTKSRIRSDKLSIGDRLSYELQRDNPHDKFAVKLFKNQECLGYVKLIHSKVFYRAKGELKIKVQHLEKNGVIQRAFIEVQL